MKYLKLYNEKMTGEDERITHVVNIFAENLLKFGAFGSAAESN